MAKAEEAEAEAEERSLQLSASLALTGAEGLGEKPRSSRGLVFPPRFLR